MRRKCSRSVDAQAVVEHLLMLQAQLGQPQPLEVDDQDAVHGASGIGYEPPPSPESVTVFPGGDRHAP